MSAQPRIVLNTVDDAVAALAAGGAVVVVDDADRENEGDLIFAAQFATPDLMGWAVRFSSGVLCVPMSGERADTLGLPPMVARNEDTKGTAFTVSCDAAEGITTGISGADRATTARLLADPATTAAHVRRPGHLFPLRAAEGGVLERRGHTEAAVDLCRLAELEPVGIIGELVRDDGSLMRLPQLRTFANEWGLPLVSIADLARHLGGGTPQAAPREPESVVGGPAVVIPTGLGDFTAQAWTERSTGSEHLTLSVPSTDPAPLFRMHSECLSGDVFGSHRCDCGEQLEDALCRIAREGGTLLYLRGHEGRGIGLANKIRAYALQDAGADTVDANEQLGLPVDARRYDAAVAILRRLGMERIRLISNNPLKEQWLREAGIDVVDTVPSHVPARPQNRRYLDTKRDRLHHRLPGAEPACEDLR